MEGNFRDGKNGHATTVGLVVFFVSFIATVIISVKSGDYGTVFLFFGVPVTVLLMVAVDSVLSKGKFSANEKTVTFSVGFSKYVYFYKSIIKVKTEVTFTNGRYGAKIPHIELVLTLRNNKIVRFSDTVPSYESETLESLKKYHNSHQFTELADYIKSRL